VDSGRHRRSPTFEYGGGHSELSCTVSVHVISGYGTHFILYVPASSNIYLYVCVSLGLYVPVDIEVLYSECVRIAVADKLERNLFTGLNAEVAGGEPIVAWSPHHVYGDSVGADRRCGLGSALDGFGFSFMAAARGRQR